MSMKFFKTINCNSCSFLKICKDIENGLIDTVREGAGMNWESSMTYIHYHVQNRSWEAALQHTELSWVLCDDWPGWGRRWGPGHQYCLGA